MSQNSTSRHNLPSKDGAFQPLQLEDFLPYRLAVLASEVSQGFAQIYGAKFDLSIPEWRVLATLGQFATVTARDICRHSRMHKTTVSRAVATLEKRGLVTLRTNLDDMREVFLTMSEAGRQIYTQIVPMARSFENALCKPFSQEEKVQFESLLTRLLDGMSKG